MKTINILVLFLVFAFQASATELDKKNMFQAELWMKNIKALWGVGDYSTLRYYCRKTVEFYPETYYAEEAEKYLKKTENPKKNRRREFMRNDPGLFLGGW